MTLTKTRAVAAVTALVAASLGALLMITANDATAGGSQVLRCEGKPETVAGNTGTKGDDVIVGTAGQDEMDGRGGDDLICSREANDEVLGGGGDDRVRGGSGRDFVNGEGGGDDLLGNGGNDGPNNQNGAKKRGIFFGIVGGPGNDIVSGGGGDDQLAGQEGTDVHNGAEGFDGCFDEEPDSEFNSCEYGSLPR